MGKSLTSSKATVELEKYLDELIGSVRSDIKNLEKNVNEKFETQRQVADKSEQVLHEKLLGMNEFREQIKEERGSLMTREMCEQRMGKMEERTQVRMGNMEERTQVQESKQAFVSGRDAALVGIPSMIIILFEVARLFK